MDDQLMSVNGENNSIIDAKYALSSTSFSIGNGYWGKRCISYVSDIHIGHHLDYSRNVISQIRNIAKSLYLSKGEYNPVIFGGDIAEDPEICKLFYHAYMQQRMFIQYKQWKKCGHHFIPPKSKKNALKYLQDRLEEAEDTKNKEIQSIKKWYCYGKAQEKMDYSHIVELLKKGKKPEYIQYHIKKIKKYEEEISYYKENNKECLEKLQKGFQFDLTKDDKEKVYVVLGNHELHAFDTVQESVDYYREFCMKEGIILLHNETKSIARQFYKKPNYYEKSLYNILGGVGFAKYNDQYNANTIVGPKKMTRDEEIKESEDFYAAYVDALKDAIEKQIPLIVISHYPTKDWLPSNNLAMQCYYFTGHTHRNDSLHTNLYNIFANNQIGYNKKDIRFKEAQIGLCINPFILYIDGSYEISIDQYTRFYDYCGDSLQGTVPIEQQLRKENSRFFMIKQSGYYGFFILSPYSDTKICVGGKLKKISKEKDITYFETNFKRIISIYINTIQKCSGKVFRGSKRIRI